MRMQASSKERKSCVMCDETIQRSEMRKVDGCMHRHLNCAVKKTKSHSFIGCLFNIIR